MFKRKVDIWTFFRRYPDLHRIMRRDILIKIIDLKSIKIEKMELNVFNQRSKGRIWEKKKWLHETIAGTGETSNAIYSSNYPARKSALIIPNRCDYHRLDSLSIKILKFHISENLWFYRRTSSLKTSRTGLDVTEHDVTWCLEWVLPF
jgi:hypothetical protein